MRKIKSLLCVLLTMIISLGSMVTVKADTEIKPFPCSHFPVRQRNQISQKRCD